MPLSSLPDGRGLPALPSERCEREPAQRHTVWGVTHHEKGRG